MKPRLFSWASSAFVVCALAHLAEDLDDADQDHEVDDPDDVEEGPGHSGTSYASDALQQRRLVLDLSGQARTPSASKATSPKRWSSVRARTRT